MTGESKMRRLRRVAPQGRDGALQRHLGLTGLRGLDRLLTGQPAGETIETAQVGALVRLIQQAVDCAEPQDDD
jgi:hypothetical protein